MKFPVLYENGTWPSTHRCPQCDKLALLSPHPMAILAGGALRVTDPDTKAAVVATDCIGLLSLFWHGGGGRPNAQLPIVEYAPLGQYELRFCSTQCLKGFLCAAVDALEKAIPRD